MAFRFNFGGPPAEPEPEPEPEPGPRPAARWPAERVEAGVGAAGPSGAPGPELEWDRLELGGPAGPAGAAPRGSLCEYPRRAYYLGWVWVGVL